MDTLHHLINVDLCQLFDTRNSKSMEVPTYEIENNYNILKQKISGISVQFIMNLDEMGAQMYDDAEIKRVIVPRNYPQSFAPYAIDIKGDRSSVLITINFDGIVGAPFFAVKRKQSTWKYTKKYLITHLKLFIQRKVITIKDHF